MLIELMICDAWHLSPYLLRTMTPEDTQSTIQAFGYSDFGAPIDSVCLNTLWEGRSKKVGHAEHARRYIPTFWPDEAYVAGVSYKFVENRDHVRMPEFIGKRDTCEQADSNTGQNTGPDRFDTVGRKISANGHAESTFRPDKRPIR